jgi:predicted anti-sigma-YlaC factor YlaD
MDCQEVQIELDAWLTGELDKESAEAVQAHLDGCPQCRQFASDLEDLRAQILAAEAGCPVQMGSDIKAAIQQIAAEQRRTHQAAQPQARRRRWGERLIWAAYGLLGLALLSTLDAPAALRLFTVGLTLNLAGLAVAPFVLKNHRKWSQI